MSSEIQNINLRDPSADIHRPQDDTRLKIGIDASRSIDSLQKTGVEKVSDELLSTINKQLTTNNNVEVIYYTPQKISWLPTEKQKILNWPLKFLWTQLRLAFELLIYPPKVFFSPVYTLPFILLFTSHQLQVTSYKVIHDVAFKKHPELYTFWQKFNLNLDLWLVKKICARIFVPTQAVKDDLLKYTKISADKIVAIHHGYNKRDKEQETRDKKKQILYLGRIEEKKNIGNLIKAFEIFNQKHPDYKLILAGPADKDFVTSYELQVTSYKNIELPGYVSGEQKEKLLRESVCLTLISKEEGFGFPILEGFDFGLPVLASDIPVLKEVGGEACLYVNPNSIEEIAQGLEKITSDENLRQNLIEQGRERLNSFSWQESAEKYLYWLLS